MPLELAKALPVALRSLKLDERWLQKQIDADPAMLGLGDVEVAGREHRQGAGCGRMDFLLRDRRQNIFYEVEVMLGALDESHLVRAVEYWDVERQRRPYWEHRAVIVAEDITARFFNVLRLFNRSIPLIAIKLSTFRVGDKLLLHPVRVLDIAQETKAMERDEVCDLHYWEDKSAGAVDILRKLQGAIRGFGVEPYVAYNLRSIMLATAGRHFCWIVPHQKGVRVDMRFTRDRRDHVLAGLRRAGIDAEARQKDVIAVHDIAAAFAAHPPVIIAVLQTAEELSRKPLSPERKRTVFPAPTAGDSNVEPFPVLLPERRRPNRDWWLPHQQPENNGREIS